MDGRSMNAWALRAMGLGAYSAAMGSLGRAAGASQQADLSRAAHEGPKVVYDQDEELP